MKKKLPIISFVFTIITMFIGVLVIIGWFTHNDFLRMLVPGQVKMKFNVAIGFVFSSIALLLHYFPGKSETRRRVFILLSVIVSLIGLLTLIEYVSGFNFGIDEIFVKDELPTTAVYYAGRMSPLAALNFLLIGPGLLLLNKEKTATYQFYYLSVIAFVSLLMLIGFNFINDIPTYIRLAIHVAIGFIILSMAIWFAQPMLHKKISFERKLITGFSAVILLIAVISAFSFYYSNKRISTSRSVKHTSDVLVQAEQTLSLVKDIESGGRGYIITSDSSYLEYFAIAKNSLFSHIARLKELTTDNPSQQVRIDSLSVLVDKRVGFSLKLIQTRNQEGFDAANKLVSTRLGDFYTTEIRKITTSIQQEENHLLTQRQVENNRSIVSFKRAFMVLLAGVFLLLVIIFFSIRNNIITRKKAEEELKKSEKNFELLVSSVKDYAIYMLDKNGCVKSWNAGAEYIKGYTAEEIIGKSIEVFYTSEEVKYGLPGQNLQRALQEGHYETEGLRVRKDGSMFYANIVFTPLVDGEGKHIGYAKVTRDITEKRKAEERISFLATIANNIQDPVIASDNNFCTTSWNDAAEKLFEWKSEEVIGKPTREVLRIIYPDHTREEILQSFTKQGYWHGEVIYHTKSGKPLSVLATASQLKDAAENVTGILVLAKDITERKKTEKQLEEFAHFFNNSHDLCGIANTVGYFEIINTNFSKVLGYSEKEFCETPFIELIHPDDIASTLHEYEKLKSGELTINFINRYRKKDGSYLFLDWNATPNPLTGKLYCVARDITDRKKAEEQIAYLARLIEGTNEAVYSVTNDFCIRTWNKGAEHLYGFTAAEAIGRPVFEIIRSHMREAERLSIREQIRKYGHWKDELEHIRKDGSSIYILASATATRNALGEIEGYVSVGRDITDRKKAEVALNKLNAELELRVKERTAEIEKKEKRFRALIENNYDIISLMDEQFNVFYRSPSAARITGWTDDEILNLDGTKKIHPDDREKAGIIITELMANPGKAIHTLFRTEHKDGHYIWVEGTVINLLRDEDVKAIVFNFRDITQRKELEDLLHKANVLARIGGWEVDIINGKIYWSNITREIHETEYSYVPDLETGINFYKEGKGRDLITQKVKEAIEVGKPWDLELQIITAKNNERWIRTIGETEFVNGKCVRIYGSFQDIDQRKRAEEKLITSEQRFRSIIEQYPSPVVRYAPDGSSIAANPAWEIMWEDKIENAMDYNIRKDPQMIASGLSKYIEQAFAGEVASSGIFQYDPSIIGKTGRKRWLQLLMYPLKDIAGNILEVILITLDMTDNKEAEEKLDKSEKLFRAMIEKDADMKTLATAGGKVFYGSPSLTKVLGYATEEYMTTPAFELIHPDDLPGLKEGIGDIIQTPGKSFFREQRLKHKNGNWIWCEGTITNMLHDPAVNALVSNFRDITERKEAQEKLTTERALLRTLIDNLPDYIYVKDTRSRHLINNKANVELLSGSTEKETIGKTVNDFLAPEMAISYLEDDQLVFQSGKPIINKEEMILSPTGETKYLLTTKVPLRDEDNSIIGLVGISRDVTWQKEIELDLRQKKYFLEKAQEVGQIGYWISEIENAGKLTWSEETCRIFGTEPAKFDGQLKTFFSFVYPGDLDRLSSATSYAVENNLTYRIEYRIILHDGATRWVYEQGEATYDENGKPLLIIGIVQDITERKGEEEKLIKNEELMRLAEANYREIFDKANDGIYVHELETGKVVNVNQRATELNGFSKEELLTGDPNDFMTDHPDYTFEKAFAHIQKAAAGEPQFFEWLGRCKDGSSSWFEVNLKKTSIGGKDRILAFQRDINARKKVEEALRRSEARARRIFESDMIGFIFWNEMGEILEANDYFLRMTGYSREDLERGLINWATMTPPEYANMDIIAIEQIADTGICKPFEKEYIRKDGSRFPISLGAAALGASFDGVGVCYVMDISERIKATETIAETLKEKNIILESIGDAFFAVDKDWTVTYWNRIAEIALSVRKQDIVGKNLWKIFSDSVDSLSYKKYHEALATNHVVHFEDFYAALHKWYEIGAYPSENGLSVYFKDVTERQKAAEEIRKLNIDLEGKVISRTEQLKKANEELEAFTYSVSHDLRAPLRGIIGFTTILEEDYSNKLDEEARRITGVIKSNTLKMGNLIDDLLTFSRMGRQDIEKTMINTAEMIQQIISNLENKNTGGGIEWVIPSLHDIYGDSNAIRQVWINLISNAIKYSGSKTVQRIEIGSALLKGQTVFFIKDNGVGFDVKYSDKLFKVFQRLHGSNEFEGTGVGLAIVEKIISKHGGKVWAKGEVDNGAVFYFSLPAGQKHVQLAIT